MLRKFRNRAGDKISRLKNKIFPGALILMYHRVAETDSDPWSLSVTPQHFAEQLAVLREYGNPLHLQELTTKISDRQSVNRSIVVTFDDGYADNLHHAKSLLEKYDIPATVFVTTGGINQQNEFWWDELDRLLLQPGRLPELLQLKIDNKDYQWELGKATNYSVTEAQRDRHWCIAREEDPSPRHTLYRSLYQKLQFLPLSERSKLLHTIVIWANAEPVGRSSHRSLTPEELLALESGGLIEIGAHTVSHPFLAKLPIAEQREEIQQSKNYLEKVLSHPVTSFSYPNGSYAPETTSIVREAGFNCACCSVAERVQVKTLIFDIVSDTKYDED